MTTGYDTVMLWSMEATILLLCSKLLDLPLVEFSALLLYAASFIMLCFFIDTAFAFTPIRNYVPVFNHRAAGFAVVAAMMWIGSTVVGDPQPADHLTISSALHYGWAIMLFLLLTVETYDLAIWATVDRPGNIVLELGYLKFHAFFTVWALYSVPLVWIGLQKKWAPEVIVGSMSALLALVLGLVAGFTYEPIEQFTVVLNFRVLALSILGVTLLVQSTFIEKFRTSFHWLGPVLLVTRIGFVLCGFILVTGETRDFFRQEIFVHASDGLSALAGDTPFRSTLIRNISLSAIWLLYTAALLAWGVPRRFLAVNVAAVLLLVFCVVKFFLIDLSFLSLWSRLAAFEVLGVLILAIPEMYRNLRKLRNGYLWHLL
jgi:uncharacterized membrane protein